MIAIIYFILILTIMSNITQQNQHQTCYTVAVGDGGHLWNLDKARLYLDLSICGYILEQD